MAPARVVFRPGVVAGSRVISTTSTSRIVAILDAELRLLGVPRVEAVCLPTRGGSSADVAGIGSRVEACVLKADLLVVLRPRARPPTPTAMRMRI